MKKARAPRALKITLAIAVALAICLGAAAAIAPGNPMAGFGALNRKPAETPSPEAVLGAVSPEDEETDAEETDAEEIPVDEGDDVVENPTEE